MSEAVKKWEEDQKRIMESEWAVGFKDRGHGHGDYAAIVKQTEKELEEFAVPILVCECHTRELAEHIVNLHNEKNNRR